MKTFRDFIFEQIGRMRIIMLGGPGSGKSTYSKYLIDHFDITHIYPGGMLRKEVEKNSEIGKQVKAIIDRGEFVPNQIVLDLIKAQIEKSPKGYILDGWPRYMQQVEDMEKNDIGYDYAVFLDVSREEVLRRLLARGRADDTEEIINNRIDLYKKETGPVVEYMRKRPGFITVNSEQGTPTEPANEIVLDLIKDKVEKSPKGYILDGWPRYMEQVEDMHKAEIGYDYAVFLDVSREEVLKRLLARGRADDTEEIINNRIELYKKETGPVIEYMRKRPGFITVNSEQGTPEETANEIIKRIENAAE